jgi:hypothetical protein
MSKKFDSFTFKSNFTTQLQAIQHSIEKSTNIKWHNSHKSFFRPL